jgi:hypothetical protein
MMQQTNAHVLLLIDILMAAEGLKSDQRNQVLLVLHKAELANCLALSSCMWIRFSTLLLQLMPNRVFVAACIHSLDQECL